MRISKICCAFVVCWLLTAFHCFGFSPSDSAQVILNRSMVEHSKLQNRKIEMNTTLLLGTNVISSMHGEIILLSDFACSDVMGIITINENDVVLMVDLPNKTILMSGRSEPNEIDGELLVDQESFKQVLGVHEKSLKTLSKNIDGSFLITIVPKDQGTYRKIELTIGNTDFLIRNAVYYFSNPEHAGVDKLDLRYSYKQFKMSDLTKKFQIQTYVFHEGNTFKLQPEYSKFRLAANPMN